MVNDRLNWFDKLRYKRANERARIVEFYLNQAKEQDDKESDQEAAVNIIDMPTDGDIGGRGQVTFPSEFPARPIPSDPEGAGETLYHMPRQAQIQQDKWYKGVDDSTLALLEETNIPGFVGSYELARIYAEPLLTGDVDSRRHIIEIHYTEEIPDISDEIREQYIDKPRGFIDVSAWFPQPYEEYRNRVWTAEGSGHIDSLAAYIGVSTQWKIIKTFENQEEWDQNKIAEIGFELAELTTERETIKTRQKDTQHGMWDESYSDSNRFEDPDLKLGESDNDDTDPLSYPVYEPYSQGTGPLNSRYEDADQNQRNIILHSAREDEEAKEENSGADGTDGEGDSHQLWICIDLDDTILSSPEEYQDSSGNHLFGEPLPGAQAALRELVDGGARVSIYTARQYFDKDEKRLKSQVAEYLDEQDIPYSDIYVGVKAPCDYYIDDKAVPFKGDWDLVLDTVRDKLKKTAVLQFPLDDDKLIKIYELEYKLSQLSRQDYLDDRLYMNALQWENELAGLLGDAITTMETVYRMYIVDHMVPHEISKQRGGYDGNVLEMIEGLEVDETYYGIINIYEKLLKGFSGDKDQDMVLFHTALTTVHHSGPMLEHLNYETGIDVGLLNDLSAGEHVPEWDSDLSKFANDPVKDTVNYHGIDIDIEWPTGSLRSYEGEDTYVTHMKCGYGFIRNVQGTDGDNLDIYLGDKDSDIIYIVEQIDDEGNFDEQKLMLGFKSEEEAVDIYLQHMPTYMFGDISEIPLNKLKNALYGQPEDRRGQEDLIPSEEQ